MSLRTLVMVAAFILCGAPSVCAAPAFECAKASGSVEALICEDEELSQLDQSLAEVYESAMKRLPTDEHAKTRAKQRGWIKGRNDCWKAEDVRGCVEVSYQTRIVELQITGGLLMAPNYTTLICNRQENIPFTTVFYNQTNPPSAVLTWGSDQVIAFIQHSGSGARYAAPGVEFWSHQGEATVDWFGTRLLCLPHGGATTALHGETLSLEALRNATYRGFEDLAAEVTLQNGRWEGEPYVVGGATLPQVQMVEDLYLSGDLDLDGSPETAVLINYAPGGTGDFLYLVIMKKHEDMPINLATFYVGDRVRIRDFYLKGNRIHIDLLQAGPDDGMCCPGDVLTRIWTFDGQRLEEQPLERAAERLSPELLQGQVWRLTRWRNEEPVASAVHITLSYKDGRLIGSSGCNNYFANAASGEMPGDITVTGVGSTRRACADPVLSGAEQRFLELLSRVGHFSWAAGKLTLSYGQGEDWGVMFFAGAPDMNMQ